MSILYTVLRVFFNQKEFQDFTALFPIFSIYLIHVIIAQIIVLLTNDIFVIMATIYRYQGMPISTKISLSKW